MSTIQQELVIKARADVANAKQGLASLDQSVDGLASAQEGLKTASNDAAQGLAAEASAATAAAAATASAAKASDDAADAARKLGTDAKAAGSGLDKATGEARKLSDQIKEVGDGLDVAAGKMIEGIGGPKAIKALAGAGMALAAVQQVAGAFLDSSEALFKSWGEEGLKVWDVTERGLFKLKGSFASAILGSDDMYLAAGRLSAGFDALNAGVQMVIAAIQKYFEIAPAGQLLKYLFDVTGATEGYADMVESATERVKRQVAAEKNAAASAGALVKPLGTAREQYESIAETVARLTGKVVDKDKVERDSTIQRLKDLQTLAIAEERSAQLKAIRDNSELKRAEFTANATRELMARAQRETKEYISKMDSDDRTLLSGSDKLEMLQSKLAELITTERPAMVEGQMARYRRDATALMNEMASPLETGTQLLIEGFQTQINDIEKEGKKLAATAGANVGKSFAGGLKTGVQENLNLVGIITEAFLASRRFFTEQFKLMVRGTDEEYQQLVGAPDPMSEADKEYYKNKQAKEDEQSLQKTEIDLGLRKSPEQIAKETSDAAAAQASAQKAGQDQIKNIQETSGAVLDLAGAFATLGGVQDGVIDKMRQVIDVVIKIMQATQALQAVQVAQAATATATAAVNATAAATTAVAATGAGAAAAGAGAAAGSAFIPVLGAVTAVVGLMGSLFGGGSEAPRRDRSGSGRTIYTSAGEAQGEGGDFAYFEGGRQNVTIVTNDAASIRTMQGRLAFVGSRGGSGF